MQKKVIILLMIIILLAGGIFAVSTAQEQIKYEGKLMQVSGIWFIKTAEDIFGLDITALSQTSEKKPDLHIGDMISVTGDRANDVINVESLQSGDVIYEVKVAEPAVEESVYKGFKVDSKRCIACGLCINNCPSHAISMVNGKAVIDVKKCIQCGICKNGNGQEWRGCPVGAINN
jgi:ferredoxin